MSRMVNKDIIWLLEILLKTIAQVDMNSDASLREVDSFFLLDAQIKIHENFREKVDLLFDYIFKMNNSLLEEGVLSFELEVLLRNGNRKKIQVKVETPFSKIECKKPLDIEGEKLCDIQQKLECSFLAKEDTAFYVEALGNLRQKRKNFLNADNVFPDYKTIEDYLQNYYAILVHLLRDEWKLHNAKELRDLLEYLLTMDKMTDTDGPYASMPYMSFYAPMVLNAVRKMYIATEKYVDQVISNNGNQLMLFLYQDATVKKVQHIFRWYMTNGRDSIYLNAVSPCIERQQHVGLLCVPYYDVNLCNSFEAINEKRVAEKIIFSLENDLKKDVEEGKTINVALLGDLHEEASLNLVQYLEDVLQKLEIKIKIIINLFTENDIKDNIEESSKRNTKVLFGGKNSLKDIFASRLELTKLLKEHEMVFMLDCTNLYQDEKTVAVNNASFLRHQFMFWDPFDWGDNDRQDIALPNYLNDLYDLLNVYYLKGYIGKYKKYANDSLLRVCEEVIKECEGHTLYVYVSDQNAFENVYCNDQYYIRTERYNQKKIGIIRYVDQWQDEELGIGENAEDKLLCFNLNQLFKHLCLERCEEIIEEISKDHVLNNLPEYELRHLYIGIDYKQWPQKLELHYYVEEDQTEEKEQFLKEVMQKIVLPIFNGGRKDMYQRYFWKAIYSFLYGNARTITDMLFIHLLKNYNDRIGKTVIAEKNNGVLLQRCIKKNIYYSYKRFYEIAMDEFDISADQSLSQQQVIYIINKSQAFGEGKKTLFERIVKACEAMGYEDSYLYRNCLRI